MVDALVGETRVRPLAVVFGTRPGPTPADVTLAGTDRLTLAGLDEPDTRRLAAAVAGAELGPSDGRRLHERTAGNPLFITETVRAIFPEGSAGDGGAHVDGRLPDDSGTVRPGLPMTLRALLGARIDALDEDARTVLRVASVIGVTFRAGTVDDVLGGTVEPSVYAGLIDASLIAPLDAPSAWRFSHPLIHDTAYWGLLGSARRELHARVADRLEQTRGRQVIGVVARHRAAAGDVERAVPLLVRAAEEAAALGAAAEAASFWSAAADLRATGAEADGYRQRARAALEAVPARTSPSVVPTPLV
jgi:predicted ATPase